MNIGDHFLEEEDEEEEEDDVQLLEYHPHPYNPSTAHQNNYVPTASTSATLQERFPHDQQQLYPGSAPERRQSDVIYLDDLNSSYSASDEPPQPTLSHASKQQADHSAAVSDHAYSRSRDPLPNQRSLSYDEDAVYELNSGHSQKVDVSEYTKFDTPSNTVPSINTVKREDREKAVKVAKKITTRRGPARTPIPEKIASTGAASEAALQRIATEEGWKQMNSWLNSALRNTKQLKALLRQCKKAEVTIQLLSSNDTPKFIRKLSKSHKDQEIRELAAGIVKKWKQEVANPSVEIQKKSPEKEVIEKEDQTKNHTEDHTSEKDMSQSMKKERRRSSSDDGGELEKKREKKEEKKEKKETVRNKARVYTAKARSTGLEGEDTSSSSLAKAAEKRKEGIVQSGLPHKRLKATMPTLAVPLQKKPPPPSKKSSAVLSSGFMDALLTPAEPKKKVIPKKRFVAPPMLNPWDASKGASSSVIDSLLSPVESSSRLHTNLEGLYADMSHTTASSSAAAQNATHSPSPMRGLVEAEEPDIVVGRRKLRFADEAGLQLVSIKIFEVEEGERINVNHYSPDEMKQMEMQMERKFMHDSRSFNLGGDEEGTGDSVPGVEWRFIPVYVADAPNVIPGGNSQMKLIQMERQKHALRAFFCPDIPQDITAEPDEDDIEIFDPHPKIIPLEAVPDAEDMDEEAASGGEEEEEDEAASLAALPSSSSGQTTAPADDSASSNSIIMSEKLKNLLEGLKRNGLVDGGAEAAAAAQLPQPAIPVINPLPSTAEAYEASSSHQQMNTYQQDPQPNPYANPMAKVHQITQHFFPGHTPAHPPMPPGHPLHGLPHGPAPPLPMPPSLPPVSSAPSDGGIKLIAGLDVHAPSFPALARGAAGFPGPAAGFPGARGGAAGAPHRTPTKACSFFNSATGCKFGARCGFNHVKVDGPVTGPPNWVPPATTGLVPPPAQPFRGRGTYRGRGDFGPPRGRGEFRGRGGAPPFRGRGGEAEGGFVAGGGGAREGGYGGPGYGRGDWERRGRGGGGFVDRRKTRSRSRSLSPTRSPRSPLRRSPRRSSPRRSPTRRSTRKPSRDIDLRRRDQEDRWRDKGRERNSENMEVEKEERDCDDRGSRDDRDERRGLTLDIPLPTAPVADTPASPSPQPQYA